MIPERKQSRKAREEKTKKGKQNGRTGVSRPALLYKSQIQLWNLTTGGPAKSRTDLIYNTDRRKNQFKQPCLGSEFLSGLLFYGTDYLPE